MSDSRWWSVSQLWTAELFQPSNRQISEKFYRLKKLKACSILIQTSSRTIKKLNMTWITLISSVSALLLCSDMFLNLKIAENLRSDQHFKNISWNITSIKLLHMFLQDAIALQLLARKLVWKQKFWTCVLRRSSVLAKFSPIFTSFFNRCFFMEYKKPDYYSSCFLLIVHSTKVNSRYFVYTLEKKRGLDKAP